MARPFWDRKVSGTHLEKFRRGVERKHGLEFDSYRHFCRWTVDHFPEFWEEAWLYFDLVASRPYTHAFSKTGPGFLDNAWFVGARMNIAESLMRYRDDTPALICVGERGTEETVSFARLHDAVAVYAAALRRHGLQAGDTVACYMSNRKEAVYVTLAALSVGALFGGPSPLYGARAATNVLRTMEPKFLFAVDRFEDDGMKYAPIDNLPAISQSVASLEKIVVVPTSQETLSRDLSSVRNGCLLEEFLGKESGGAAVHFEQLPFDHPAFVNFTSGTTGLPKGPVHSQGSVLAFLRDLGLHIDLRRGDVAICCYSVGWMLYEYFLPSLALGAAMLLYEGFPGHAALNFWDVASRHRASFAFVTTTTVETMARQRIRPSAGSSLDAFRTFCIGGSPVMPHHFEYVRSVRDGIFVASMYGCSESFGSYCMFDLNEPVYSGECQSPALGVDLRCFDEQGNSVVGDRGEAVICNPAPGFPLRLWKDEGNARLRDTYFARYPGVWHQGDACRINPKTKGFLIMGRSDDTIKQNDERFGPGDIYFALEGVPGVEDFVCVGQSDGAGRSRAVLFVKPRVRFAEALRTEIADRITRELGDDFVPEAILPVPDVPYNLNNKRMESVVRRIVATNRIPEGLQNVRNPECLKHFVDVPELVAFLRPPK